MLDKDLRALGVRINRPIISKLTSKLTKKTKVSTLKTTGQMDINEKVPTALYTNGLALSWSR